MDSPDKTPHRSRTFPAGEPQGMSAARPRPEPQPLQPVVQPRGWLRALLTLSAPGLMLAIILGIVQLCAPYDWKPSVLVGTAIATYEVTVIRETLMDRAEAEEKIAQARAEGEREAELAFQEDLKAIELEYADNLATLQTNLQSGMEAYKSLYDRANMIQQAVYQMEGVMLQYKQQAIRETQSGKTFIANASDIGCYFVPDLCHVGDDIRGDLADELNEAGRSGAGNLARDYLRDLPDPARLQGEMRLPAPRQEES